MVLLFCLQLSLTRFHSLFSPSREALAVFGAFTTELWQNGEYWRALTMGIAHIGIIHLVFNLMALSQTMAAFEEAIGPWPTLVLITLTQVGAVAAHTAIHSPYTLTAGASGIAFGLIGFGIAYFHRSGHPAQRRFFIQWFVYGLVFGFLVGANHAAHIGGFLTGLPLGYLAAGMRIRHRGLWRAAGILSLATWLLCLGCLGNHIARNRQALQNTLEP
jgi:rhomboid protease GluP